VRRHNVGDIVEIIVIRMVRDELTTITLQVTLLEYSNAGF